MGKGRDKRKKHEDPEKAMKRAEKQAAKAKRNQKDDKFGATEGGVAMYGEEDITQTVQKLRKKEEKKKTVVEQQNVPPPSPRANGVFLPHPTKEGELILFGGEFWDGESTVAYNDMYVFNVPKGQWRTISSPLTPSPRSSIQALTYKQFMIVHGGEFVSQSQSQFLHFRDTWKFDCNTCIWEEMKIKTGPSARSGHRMVPWKNKAVLFGGFYDNALETKYYDDLWILSDIDGVGRWDQVTFAPFSEAPHKRSGHAMGVYEDTVFVYGGYSTEKLNRFGKTEATVHHDLWCAPLSSTATAVWTKIKLAGIPPPIRSGVSFAQREKKLLLFGGVVDLDAPGGKALSTFQNDIFTFQLDTRKFYPLTLKSKKKGLSKKQQKPKDEDAGTTGSLAKDLARLDLEVGDSSSDDDDDSDAHSGVAETENPESVKFAHLINKFTGQILPKGRMNSMMCIHGHTLYLFGGQVEVGKKEITMNDLYSLNLNRMETWDLLNTMSMDSVQWKGRDDDDEASNAGSWEDGSTVVDTDEIARLAELDEDASTSSDEEDHPRGRQVPEATPAAAKTGDEEPNPAEGGSDDDDEDIPDAIPFTGLKEADGIPLGIDGRTKVKGKIGRKAHKDQLKAQLGSTSVVPTPILGEHVKEFFKRTQKFWNDSAKEALEETEGVTDKLIIKTAFQFAKLRYDEAIMLMEQIEHVEQQQKEEDKWIREHFEEKKRLREERERRQQEEDEEEESSSSGESN